MHVIKLDGYNATVDNGEKLELGTFDSYGEEQLQIFKAPDWGNLSVIATFNSPNKKSVQVVVDAVTGVIKVPKEATADLYGVGTIVFVGLADGVQRISADVEYIVKKHSNASGTEPAEPTPSVVKQILTEAQNANVNSAEAKKLAANVKDIAQSIRTDADNGKFNGAKGDTGAAGKDGLTPHIGENVNWWIEDTDTGVSAKGAKGDTGAKGEKGDTGAQGPVGETGPVGPKGDTGPQGERGEQGPQGKIGPEGPAGKDGVQIDDSAVSENAPWSSKHIIDMLCPPLEESGNPVVCYPVAGYPLDVKAKWEPVQEGSGTPSPENIRPIKGRDIVTITRQEDNQVITLTLPETVYGGEVDVATGEGQQVWKSVTLDGTENWNTWGVNKNNATVTGFYTYDINDYSDDRGDSDKILCSAVLRTTSDIWGGKNVGIGFADVGSSRYLIYCVKTDTLSDTTNDKNAITSFETFLADLYTAGTPVQVAYVLNEPVSFTATGAQPIPALAGANTVLTDADSVTVTGRADPIKRITDLEDAVASQT